MTLRVFIYGSCVTRDAVEIWDPAQFEMAGYVARQSLISAMSPASDVKGFRLSQIDSSFQRRMMRGDIESSLLPALESAKDDYDVILWDLTDERNGVQQLPDGGWMTRLRNFQKVQIDQAKLGQVVPTGSIDHSKLWARALDAFLARLRSIGVLDRLVLNDTRWATRDDAGETFSNRETFLNADLEVMSHLVQSAGITAITPEPQSVLAANSHKWGRAPFHFVEDTYRSITENLLSATKPLPRLPT